MARLLWMAARTSVLRPRRPRQALRGTRLECRRSSSTRVALAGTDRLGDGVTRPWCGTGIDRVVGAERVAGPVQVQPIVSVGKRNEVYESTSRIRTMPVAFISK